ncbi:MAG: hypothetical protein AB2L11_03210 [Syntrophobacteraceae bacterium]
MDCLSFLNFLYGNGLWISVPIFAAGLWLLVSFIRNVVRLRKESEILSVSPAEQQYIEFGEAGRVVLCIEGPLFTRRFAKTDFDLSADDGTPVRGRTTWFHARSSSFSKARMEMKLFDLPTAGRYALRISNWGTSRAGDEEHRIVFMKPHLTQMVIYIVGIVLSSFLVIGSIVLFLMRLFPGDAYA